MRSDDFDNSPNRLVIGVACIAIGLFILFILLLVSQGCTWNFSIRDNLKGVEIRRNEPSPMGETFRQENGKEKTTISPKKTTWTDAHWTDEDVARESSAPKKANDGVEEKNSNTLTYLGWIGLCVAIAMSTFALFKK